MSEQLDRLIAAVEAGLPSPTNWRNFAALPVGDDDNPSPMLAHRAYHGSLDAAKALHEALLPGWRWWVADALYWTALDDNAPSVTLCIGTPGADLKVVTGHADSPARAWLLAILRAYKETLA